MKTIAFLFLSFPAFAAVEPIEIVPLEKLPFSLIEVELKGHGKTRMIVDTGASETVLANWFADERKVKMKAEEAEGEDSGAKTFKMRKAESGELKVGDNVRNFSGFYVVPVPAEFKLGDIGGIFSPQTYFEDQTVLLDFPGKKILGGKFSSKWVRGKRKIERIPIRACSLDTTTKYLVDLSINGVPGSFYLDTGGIRSAITRDFKAKLTVLGPGLKAQREGVGSKRDVERFEGLKLAMGSINKKIVADVEPDRVACRNADGKLGNDFLGRYALLLDKKRKSITFYQ